MTITKSEAAKRWGVAPSAVTKYIGRGLPVLPGGRLDWEAVDRWRKRYNEPSRSGSFHAREEMKAVKHPGPAGPPEPFVVGFIRARASLREYLPEVLATMRPAAELVQERIAVLAIIDHLLEFWLDHPQNVAGALPAINWKFFKTGITPKDARVQFEALQADFALQEIADSRIEYGQ